MDILIILTVVFFTVVVGTVMGVPFAIYLKRDHRNASSQHPTHFHP